MTYFVVNPYDNSELNIDNPEELNPKELNISESFKNLLIRVKRHLEILDDTNTGKSFKYKRHKTIEIGDIKHVFINRYDYRRGCVFLALYKCLKETKLLWYYSKTIHHSSISFGTTPTIEVVNQLKIDFYESEEHMELFKKAKQDMEDYEDEMVLKCKRMYKTMSLWDWLKSCPLYHRHSRRRKKHKNFIPSITNSIENEKHDEQRRMSR